MFGVSSSFARQRSAAALLTVVPLRARAGTVLVCEPRVAAKSPRRAVGRLGGFGFTIGAATALHLRLVAAHTVEASGADHTRGIVCIVLGMCIVVVARCAIGRNFECAARGTYVALAAILARGLALFVLVLAACAHATALIAPRRKRSGVAFRWFEGAHWTRVPWRAGLARAILRRTGEQRTRRRWWRCGWRQGRRWRRGR